MLPSNFKTKAQESWIALSTLMLMRQMHDFQVKDQAMPSVGRKVHDHDNYL